MKKSSMTWALVAVLSLVGVRARADEPVSNAGDERRGSVFVDPLGFVMFGPRIGVEAGTAHFTGALVGRWFNAAVLSHSLFLTQGDDFAFSWGAGFRGRYYRDEGQQGPQPARASSTCALASRRNRR